MTEAVQILNALRTPIDKTGSLLAAADIKRESLTRRVDQSKSLSVESPADQRCPDAHRTATKDPWNS